MFMHFTLLETLLFSSGIVLILMAGDIFRQKKILSLHSFVFVMIGTLLCLFVLFPNLQDSVSQAFGAQRGADVLVYASVIILFYWSLVNIRKIEQQGQKQIEMIRALALDRISLTKRRYYHEVFVVPTYNEGDRVLDTLKALRITRPKALIIIVDDGSTDTSALGLYNWTQTSKDTLLIRHIKNIGQGGALETGFSYIRRCVDADFVVTYDADGQHRVEDLERFYEAFSANPLLEIGLGSRFLSQKPVDMPLARRCILKGGILFTYFVSGIFLSDTHNGYRVMRGSVLQKIALSLSDMSHASEILDIIARKNIVYQEVPVVIEYTQANLAKGQSGFNALRIAKKIFFYKWFL